MAGPFLLVGRGMESTALCFVISRYMTFACGNAPRYVLAPDPQREKKRRIRRVLGNLPKRSVMLVEEETDLLLCPPPRAMWSQRDEPARVMLNGWNAHRVVFRSDA